MADETVRLSPMVPASLADTRARRRLGIAIAAMIPMITITISSSMSEKPFWFFMVRVSFDSVLGRSIGGTRTYIARQMPRLVSHLSALYTYAYYSLRGSLPARQILSHADN